MGASFHVVARRRRQGRGLRVIRPTRAGESGVLKRVMAREREEKNEKARSVAYERGYSISNQKK